MSIRPESGPPRLRGALPRSFVLSLAISAAVLVIPGFIVEGRSLEASQPVGAPEKSAAASESLTEQFGLARAEAAAGPPMTVHIGAAIVEWWAPDGTDVEGELVRGGTVVVTGTGHSHQGGWVDVGFRKPEGSGSPSEPTYFSIRAGDVVRLSHTDGSESVTATVPQLTAKIDPETDSISGSAEPGSTLRVVSAHPDDRLLHVLWQEGWHDSRDALLAAPVPEPGDHRSVTVDDDGGWSVLDLDRDIRAGDVAWITASDVDGNGFVLDAAAPSVLIREDGLVLGVGTSGSKTIVQMFDEDGASLGETTMQFHPRAPSWGRVQRYLPFGFGLLELERDVAIGDRIETTSRLMPESAPTFGSFIVPALTVEASDDGAIIGAAPATSDVWFGAVGPDSQAASGRTDSGVDGRWSASPPLIVGPGSRLAVAARLGDGGPILLRSAFERQIRVMIGSPYVRLLSPAESATSSPAPSHPVTVTLFNADGSVRAQDWRYSSDGDSRFTLIEPGRVDPWGWDILVPISAGDRLEVGLSSGDPIVLIVPELEVSLDEDEAVLLGTAPPFAVVDIHSIEDILSLPAGLPSAVSARSVSADATGEFSISLDEFVTDAAEFLDPLWGTASMSLPGGHAVVAGFAAPRIDVNLDTGALSGYGPPWHPASVTLRDAGGDVVAVDGRVGLVPAIGSTSLQFDTYGGPGWRTSLVDRFGSRVQPGAGDRLEVTFGGSTTEVEVTPLDGVLFAEEDRIAGHATPDADVLVRIMNVGEFMSVADSAGRFEVGESEHGIDLQWDHDIRLSQSVGRHTFRRSLVSPGILLDLDRGTAEGSIGPSAPFTTTLSRDGEVLGEQVLRAGPKGAFRWVLATPGGDTIKARTLDLITVSTATGVGDSVSTELLVPRLEIEPNAVLGEFRIHTEPGFFGNVTVRRPFGSGSDQTFDVPSDGIVVIREEGGAPLAMPPGTSVNVTLRLPQGHRVTRQLVLPALNVQVGGAEACGWGDPGAAVTIDVMRDGAPFGAARGRVDSLGHFAVTVRDELGVARALSPNDRVAANVGAQAYAAVLVPLDGRMDWSSRTFSGTAPPEVTGHLEYLGGPGLSKPGCSTLATTGQSWRPWNSDMEGHFGAIDISWLGFAIWDPRTYILELSHDVSPGVRQFRLIRSLRVEVVAETAFVRGEASAGEAVAVQLTSSGGEVLGSAVAVADSSGQWSAVVRDAGGSDATVLAGHTVIVASEHERAELLITPLGFDRVGEKILAIAQPRQYVRVTFGLDDIVRGGRAQGDLDETRSVFFEADAAGRFEIPLAGPRSGWSERDVNKVRAAVSLGGLHELVAEWVRMPDLGAEPRRVYLPWSRLQR